jgi:hypothetical protein
MLGTTMDTIFWVGLLMGGLLSIPLSIAANLWTDVVRGYLDKRRHIRLSNKKSKEVRTYFFVRALREGNPTAKVILDIESTLSNRAAIFTAICFGGLFSIIILVAANSKFAEYPKSSFASAAIFAVAALAFHLAGMMLHFKLLQIRRRLKWFNDYETGIRVKWGDDALEEFMAAYQPHPTE